MNKIDFETRVTVLKSKLHRAAVTDSNLNYVGSITIDPVLMEAANLYPYEKVQIVNINNGARFETYVIEGESGDRGICLNGACARLAEVGDRVIVMSYHDLPTIALNEYSPIAVMLDKENSIVV
ncbi:MAG: aspartate 1-decarboxylase [Arenicella sp.]|nr:aspartate 1-decarboxylase [Arenicella sp.]